MTTQEAQIFIRFDNGGDSCANSKFPAAVELEFNLLRVFSLTPLYMSPSLCKPCSSLPNTAHLPPRGVPAKHGADVDMGIATDMGTTGGEKFNPLTHGGGWRGLEGWEVG